MNVKLAMDFKIFLNENIKNLVKMKEKENFAKMKEKNSLRSVLKGDLPMRSFLRLGVSFRVEGGTWARFHPVFQDLCSTGNTTESISKLFQIQ